MSDQTPPNANTIPQTPGSKSRRGAIVFLTLLMIVALAVAGAAAFGWWALFAETSGPETFVEIVPGQSLTEVSRTLEEQGLIRNALALRVYGRLTNRESSLQAGTYLISPPVSASRILTQIAGGDAVIDEITISIPEGLTLADIAARVQSAAGIDRDLFLNEAVVTNAVREFDFLDGVPDGTSLEGYLFPDTYRVYADASAAEIVRVMLSRFGDQLLAVEQAMVSDAGVNAMALHEIVTLASIVQREAGNSNEMAAIAGVFWNRLNIRMPLESDATVNYALGSSRRQPTFADTATQHPYNTYTNYGLPPGPIGNPGLDALVAVVAPESHEYLFFLHPLDAEIVLSHTYEEHLENKRLYLD